jgi:hypothetical protein
VTERCSDLSRAAGEPLGATASTVERWLLVEVEGSWPRDVGDGAALPEPARETVADWLRAVPRSRLMFVRRPRSRTGGGLVFVVRSEESRAEVRRIEPPNLADLARLDLDTAGDLVDGALVLVCGHGSRDGCCALRGTAVFAALADRLGEEEAWISSHQGGHRFAPNVLVLPAGLQFGRVDPALAPFLVARALAGKVELEHYRGRTCYDGPVQAAELAVRVEAGLAGVGELVLKAVDGARVTFRAWDGAEYTVDVEERFGPSVPASCGAPPELQHRYHAVPATPESSLSRAADRRGR